MLNSSVPAVFMFSLSETGSLSYYETLKLDGNPLDLVVEESTSTLIISIDNFHKPGSTDQPRMNADDAALPLVVYNVKDSLWVESPLRFDVSIDKVSHDADAITQSQGLSGTLYTIENLRKRGGEE